MLITAGSALILSTAQAWGHLLDRTSKRGEPFASFAPAPRAVTCRDAAYTVYIHLRSRTTHATRQLVAGERELIGSRVRR